MDICIARSTEMASVGLPFLATFHRERERERERVSLPCDRCPFCLLLSYADESDGVWGVRHKEHIVQQHLLFSLLLDLHHPHPLHLQTPTVGPDATLANSRRYIGSSHSFGYSFPFGLIVKGVRAIVLGFRVRVRIRGLGDQNYEVGFETIGTVTQNYGNCSYSDYFSPLLGTMWTNGRKSEDTCVVAPKSNTHSISTTFPPAPPLWTTNAHSSLSSSSFTTTGFGPSPYFSINA